MRVERIDMDEWADILPAEGIEVFHTPAALSVLGDHVAGDLQLFAGYKGDRPVGLMPVVVDDRLLSTVVVSPPPGKNVPRLGPITMPTSPKRRKQERVNRRFTSGVLDEIENGNPLELFRMVCHVRYTDPRPFVWRDFDVSTKFTYLLDCADREPDDVLGSFSKSLRRDIRDADELEITVNREGIGAAREVYERTRERYREQGRGFPLPWPFVEDLVSALADENRARVYTIRDPDGELLTGITVLYSNETAYFWQGGTRTVYEDVGLNSYLHWHIIRDIMTDPPRESVHQYDLMGANTERLCRYKSKFAAALVPYFVVESGGRTMSLAKRTYSALVR